MAALLGSGYIELSVRYKGALDQIRSDLSRVEGDSKKTSDVIESHVKRAVESVGSSTNSMYADLKKAHDELGKAAQQQAAAEKKLADDRNSHFDEFTKKHRASTQEIQADLQRVEIAQKQTNDKLQEFNRLNSEYTKSIREQSSSFHYLMRQGTDAFSTWGASTTTMAGHISAGITYALVRPISLGIQGIKWAFQEVFDFALGAAKTAMLGIGATITGAIGAAFYKGVQRLDNLADVRLKFKYDGLSSSQTESILSDVRSLSKRIAVPFDEMMSQAEIFAAAGMKSGSDITRILEDAANVAGKTGQSISSVSDTMLRFMEGNTQRASMVLQTWQNNGFNIIGGLAKQLGTTNDMVIDMLQKGKISWAMVQREIETQLNGFAEKSGQTIRGQLARVWESITSIGEAALEPFFGSAVTGISGLVDKLDEWANWLRTHQPEIVQWVGEIGQKFLEIGGEVMTFAGNVSTAFANMIHAAGTFFDAIGKEDTANALWDAADAIKAAGNAIAGTAGWFDEQKKNVAGWAETLKGATQLTQAFAGATGEAQANGNMIVTGTAEQIAKARENLDKLGLRYNGLEPGKLEILPDTENAKRLIDDFRVAAGQAPIWMDVYLRTHQAGSGVGADGAVHGIAPAITGKVGVGGNVPGPNRTLPNPGGVPFAVDANGKPLIGPDGKPLIIQGVNDPQTLNPWSMEGARQRGATNPFGMGWDWLREHFKSGAQNDGFLEDGKIVLNAPNSAVRGSPGQGFPLPGHFNLPLDADPTPAVETVKSFTDEISKAQPTPAPITADVDKGKTVTDDWLKAILDADPTAAPLTADMKEAEKQYKSFTDMVRNNPLAVPMMMGMPMMGGGMNPSNVSTAGLKPQSLAALNAIQTQFPQVPLTSGFRATDPYEWHPGGRGLDLGIPQTPAGKVLGDQVNQWILANKEVLGVVGTLWQVKDHFDHIHVSLKDAMSPLLAMGGTMPGAGMDVSASFGGGGGGGAGFRPGGGMGGGVFRRAPMLPGVDDDTTGPKPLPGGWTPTGIPGIDPNHTKPDKADKADKGPGYSGDYADPNKNYLPTDAGFFDPNLESVMNSPEVTPEEAKQLRNKYDQIHQLEGKLDIANQQLEELKATKNVKPSTMQAKQQQIENLQTQLENAKDDLAILEDKVLQPKPAKATKGGKGGVGKNGKGFWDQTLGEFVQGQMQKMSGVGDIGMSALQDNMIPGFSDPTTWGVTQAGAGLMNWLGGIMPDPYSGGALSMVGAALGGSGSGMASAAMGMLPYPFGSLQVGSPADSPGALYDPLLYGGGGGGAALPVGAVPMPGLDGAGNQVHMPNGSAPGQPILPGPGGNIVNDNRIQVNGETANSFTQNTLDKATTKQAPVIRNILGPKVGR